MAHDNDGRIYVDPSSTGVCISDLQIVLGRGTGDLGLLCSDKEWNAAGTALVSVNKTNKFSKFKPFRNSAICFSFDKTQATPELRSPDRLTQALATNFGLTIPSFTPSQFKTHYSDPWVYNPPRGKDGGGSGVHEWFRMLDFDGYIHQSWQLGVSNNRLFTIFDGTLGVASMTVFAGDPINFGIQCCDENDTGLLYPYSFYEAVDTSRLDISKCYVGLALLDHNSNLFVITGDQIRAHGPEAESQYYQFNKTIPAGLTDGIVLAIPILATNQFPSWDSSPNGSLISLDGAFLTLTKQSSYNALVTTITVAVSGSNVIATFSIRNASGSDVQMSGLYAFLMSNGSRANDPDPGYSAPVEDPGVEMYIYENWRNSGSVPMSNPGYIYLTDWCDDSQYTPPAYLAARAYDPWTDFRNANPNTSNRNVIRAGATVSWSHTFSNVASDAFGAYSGSDDSAAWIQLCIDHFVAGGGHYRYIEEASTWD